MTKTSLASILAVLFGAVVAPSPLTAEATIGYTGVLVGDAQSEWWQQSLTDQAFAFRLCTTEVGACMAPCAAPPTVGCIWQQEFTGVGVEGGHFSVELGGVEGPFPATAFAGDAGLWLQVEHAGTVLGPRVKLTRVPLAVHADNCDEAAALRGATACQQDDVPKWNATAGSWACGQDKDDVPAGSGNYIQNQTASPQEASININGDAAVGNLTVAGVMTHGPSCPADYPDAATSGSNTICMSGPRPQGTYPDAQLDCFGMGGHVCTRSEVYVSCKIRGKTNPATCYGAGYWLGSMDGQYAWGIVSSGTDINSDSWWGWKGLSDSTPGHRCCLGPVWMN